MAGKIANRIGKTFGERERGKEKKKCRSGLSIWLIIHVSFVENVTTQYWWLFSFSSSTGQQNCYGLKLIFGIYFTQNLFINSTKPNHLPHTDVRRRKEKKVENGTKIDGTWCCFANYNTKVANVILPCRRGWRC